MARPSSQMTQSRLFDVTFNHQPHGHTVRTVEHHQYHHQSTLTPTSSMKNSDSFSNKVEDQWDKICDRVEEWGDAGKWVSRNVLRRLSIEAPVVVCFVFLCCLVHVLNVTIMPGISAYFGVRDTFQPYSFMQYPRLVTHVFAHDGNQHLKGNMVNLLLVGPSAEHVFGSYEMLLVFLIVAVTSAVAHILIGGTNTSQLGASGIVFATILLNSLVAAKSGKIPISFVLTAGLWVTDEAFKLLFSRDGVSHHAHLAGALVGSAAGYAIIRRKEEERARAFAHSWWFYTQKRKAK